MCTYVDPSFPAGTTAKLNQNRKWPYGLWPLWSYEMQPSNIENFDLQSVDAHKWHGMNQCAPGGRCTGREVKKEGVGL